MGLIKKEVKAFTKEAVRQGCILIFGSAPKPEQHKHKKIPGAVKQYNKMQQWGRRNGYR